MGEGEKDSVEPSSEERLGAAVQAFAKAGVHPPKLAQGGDWYIDAWAGEQPWNDREKEWDSITMQELQDAAQLLARVHAVPIGWYDTHREKIMEQNPLFRECSMGSHAWLTASRLKW